MKIWKGAAKVSVEDPMLQYDFDRFENQAGDFYLIESRIGWQTLEKIKEEKIVYIQVEEPNRFLSPDKYFRGDEYDTYFYKIFTCCPYTADWLNKIQGKNRREEVFIPINENKIPPETEKKYDIIYVGNVTSREIARNTKVLAKFNYRLIARYGDLVTNRDVSYKEKMKLISECKIGLVHGILNCSGKYLRAAWDTQRIHENEAFREIPRRTWWRWLWSFVSAKEYVVPQLKTRLTETAAARALMLYRRDPFNIIERWYTPDVDFVYYEDGKLEEKIREILGDWHTGKYQKIIDNAYEKTIRFYTTQVFFDKYLKNLK